MLESWLDAGCCLNANRNAFLCDWCRFVQQILLSHAHITRRHIFGHGNSDIFTVAKTLNCYENILVYLAMWHMRYQSGHDHSNLSLHSRVVPIIQHSHGCHGSHCNTHQHGKEESKCRQNMPQVVFIVEDEDAVSVAFP